MQPMIIFLGTGQGSRVVGKQLRASGGIVVKEGEHQLWIDPGPCSLHMAKEYYVNPRETTALLVSHNHLRHCNDLNIVIDAMTYGGLDKKGVLISNDLVVNGDNLTRPAVTRFHKNSIEKFMVLKAKQRAAIDDIEILATTTMHSVDAVGFKITTPNFILSYLGDTAYCPELLEEHSGADIAVLNVVEAGDVKARHNLNSENAIKILKKLKPRLAVISHFSLKMLEADPLMEARQISRETGISVMAAKDGMVVNPMTYARKRTQKKLGNF